MLVVGAGSTVGVSDVGGGLGVSVVLVVLVGVSVAVPLGPADAAVPAGLLD